MITYREINDTYTDWIYRIGRHEFGKTYWFTKKYIKETFDGTGFYYGAFDDEKLVGAILARKFDRPKIWIYLFCVHETYQRQGIGTQLLKMVEETVPKSFFMVFVDIGPDDEHARNFYEKHGFKRQATMRDWFGKGKYGEIYSKMRKKAKAGG
jgi:ribosomal protein S18 acetylase RimI-like enzyme